MSQDVQTRALELLEQLKPEIVKNPYATTYYNAMGDAGNLYGLEGTRTQIRYILVNVRVPKEKKAVKQELLKLTEKPWKHWGS